MANTQKTNNTELSSLVKAKVEALFAVTGLSEVILRNANLSRFDRMLNTEYGVAVRRMKSGGTQILEIYTKPNRTTYGPTELERVVFACDSDGKARPFRTGKWVEFFMNRGAALLKEQEKLQARYLYRLRRD
jgi:hypothetical protein